MIISDEIEVATIVNQRWNETLRNYSDYRIATPIKFGNREWCDDDKIKESATKRETFRIFGRFAISFLFTRFLRRGRGCSS